MSVLSLFLHNHLVPALEKEFISHKPEMQDLLLKEVTALAEQVVAWLDSKIEKKQ